MFEHGIIAQIMSLSNFVCAQLSNKRFDFYMGYFRIRSTHTQYLLNGSILDIRRFVSCCPYWLLIVLLGLFDYITLT